MLKRIFFFFLLIPSLAPLFAAERPNILMAIADDWSYPHAGAYGCAWVETPAFDRVATEGVLFTRAYTPNAKCAPSRSAILTGRNSWQLEASANHWNFFPPKFMTYPEALIRAGYVVGYTTKGWAPGIALTADGKPRALMGRNFSSRKLTPPTTGISTADYAANFADFLDAASDGSPWCFWYGSVEPHRKYEYGTGVSVGGKKLTDPDRVPAYWPDDPSVRNDMLDYALETEHFDTHLGLMLAELERRGQLDNTLVLVTGDNGMPFPRAKGQGYEISNHLPLAMRWPGGIAYPGRTVDDYVSFIDFAPTLLAAAGIDWASSGMSPTPGRELQPLLAARKSGVIDTTRDHVLIGKERHDIGRPHDWGYPIRGIVRNGWLYLRNYETARWPAGDPETGYLNTDGGATKTDILDLRRASGANRFWQLAFGKRPEEELYNLSIDPDCVTNLASHAEYDGRRIVMREMMEAQLTVQDDPRMRGEGSIFEAYPYADEKFRGFYEKYLDGKAPTPGWVEAGDFEEAPLD